MAQEHFNYATNDNTITITGYSGLGGAVGIPDTINGWPVTGIGANAFEHKSAVTSVTFPGSLTNVGDFAFYRSGLTNLDIPAGIITIGDRAFSRCTNLLAITVAAANPRYSSVGGVMFDNTQTRLLQFPTGRSGSYTISNNVVAVGDYAFEYCASLTNVSISNSVVSIGSGAFQRCVGLRRNPLPVNPPPPPFPPLLPNLAHIGNGAFFYCTGLTNVIIPGGVTNIGSMAFACCTNLGRLTISNSSATIGDAAFYSSLRLTNVILGSNILSIGEAAFFCSGLTNVILPASVTNIGTGRSAVAQTRPERSFQPVCVALAIMRSPSA